MRICLIVKDEYPNYLDEWIYHHELLGDISIYNNGYPIIVKSQSNIEIIPIVGTIQQLNAYIDCCLKHPRDYILFIDSDEFFIPEKPIKELEFICKNWGALAFNWQVYGSSGLKNHDDRSQKEKFVTKLPINHPLNRHVKTLVQGSNVKDLLNPHYVTLNKGCYNRPITNGLSEEVNLSLGYINHYFIRSEQEFQEKIQRGRADYPIKRNMKEFYAVDKECV